MIYSNDDLLPVSYIAQYEYCARRVGLLMLEQQWVDNIHTVEGEINHQRVHSGLTESRGNLLVLRAVNIVSYSLGLQGKADCIELKRDSAGCTFPGIKGNWSLCPVEYKHGAVRDEPEYELQVCAQAMCLEEMCACHIEFGYLFYEGDHRRVKVMFDLAKRQRVIAIAQELHHMQKAMITPSGKKTKRCNGCSMVDVCLPDKLKNPRRYIEQLMNEAGGKLS